MYVGMDSIEIITSLSMHPVTANNLITSPVPPYKAHHYGVGQTKLSVHKEEANLDVSEARMMGCSCLIFDLDFFKQKQIIAVEIMSSTTLLKYSPCTPNGNMH
ncbi:hypothetical protein Lal_00026746 [Lupinus albus]|nr:hypothetical protein Lal_00026746 [Lupinus albus]